MDQFQDKLAGLVWGWRSIVIMGIVAPFLFCKALYSEASNPYLDEDEEEEIKKINKMKEKTQTK